MNTTGSKMKKRVISGAVGAALLMPITATGAFAQDSTDAIVEQAIEQVEAPVQEAPVEEAPVQEAPAEVAPVEVAPEPAPEPVVEEAPAPAPAPVEPPAPAPEPAPVEVAPEPVVAPEPAPAPVDPPVEVAPEPVVEAPVQEAPVQEAPAEVEEAPVEETPAEEPVEEPAAPVEEEAPVDTPVEEAPETEDEVDETPADVEDEVDETPTDAEDVDETADTVEAETPERSKTIDDLTPEEREDGELFIGGSVNINPWVDFDKLFLERINDIREENGLNRLAQAGGLYEESLNWSKDMAGEGILAHDPDVFEDIENAQCLNGGGENVYWSSMMGAWEGNTEFMVDRAITSYMESDGHRENILRPEFTHHISATVTGLADYRGQTFNTHRFGSNCPTLSLEAAVAGLDVDDSTGDTPSDYDGEQNPPSNGDDTGNNNGDGDTTDNDTDTGNNNGGSNTGGSNAGGTTGSGSNAGGNDATDNSTDRNTGNTADRNADRNAGNDTNRGTGAIDNDGAVGSNDSTGMKSGAGVVSDDLITADGVDGEDATENGEETLADAGAENSALAGVGFGAIILGAIAFLFGRRKPQTDL